MLSEKREKIAEADVKKAEEAIEDAKRAVNEGGVPRLRAAKENVERSLHKIAEELYKTTQAARAAGQAGAAAGAGAGGGSSAGSGGAQEEKPGRGIDAQYVVVVETRRRDWRRVSVFSWQVWIGGKKNSSSCRKPTTSSPIPRSDRCTTSTASIAITFHRAGRGERAPTTGSRTSTSILGDLILAAARARRAADRASAISLASFSAAD